MQQHHANQRQLARRSRHIAAVRPVALEARIARHLLLAHRGCLSRRGCIGRRPPHVSTVRRRRAQLAQQHLAVDSRRLAHAVHVQIPRDLVRRRPNGRQQRVERSALPLEIREPSAALEQLHLPVEHIHRRREQLLHRVAPVLRDEGIRVLTLGQRHHAHRHAARQQHIRRAETRFLSGGIAVVEKKGGLRVFREEIRLPLRERRAHRRDDRLEPRVHEPHHVEVSLHQYHAFVATDRVARVRKIVEQLPLGKDLRFGGVQVFRLARPDQPSAEPHGVRVRVENREDQAIAEARPRLLLLLAFHEQPDLEQALLGVPETVEVRAHQAQFARRESEPEAIRGLARHAALRQILARRRAVVALPQHLAEPPRGGRVELPKRLARIGTLAAALHLPHFDAGLLADVLHRLDERETEPLLHEGEHRSLFAAHEAGVPALGLHREVVVRALMERAGAAVHRPHFLEAHVLADDGDDVRRLRDLVYDFIRDHDSSAMVTPAPPSFHAPMRKVRTRVSPDSSSATRSRSAPVPFP